MPNMLLGFRIDTPGTWILELDKSIALDDGLMESVCCGGLLVAAVYDSVPLSRFTVVIQPLQAKHRLNAEPVQLICRIPLKPPEFLIHVESQRDGTMPGGVRFVFRKVLGEPCEGLSFSIRWSDGGTSRGPDGTDFEIGRLKQHVVGRVEIPLPWKPPPGYASTRAVSWYRDKEPFWHVPKYHSKLSDIPDETQFTLIEVKDPANLSVRFAGLLPLADACAGTRASIFGCCDNCIGVRVESGILGGLSIQSLSNARVLCSSVSSCLFEATSQAVQSAAQALGTFCSRVDKISDSTWTRLVETAPQPFLNGLGFCTWDAFATDVNRDVVVNAVKYLQENKVPIASVIIDDGWQAGGGGWEREDDPRRPALSSFGANGKFQGSLNYVGKELGIPIYAWVTIIGYWGGVRSESSPFVSSSRVHGSFGVGLSKSSMDSSMRVWRKEFQAVVSDSDSIERFLGAYYKSLALDGVAGLKVDAQALLEGLCNYYCAQRTPNRVDLALAYRKLMRKAYAASFGNTLAVNCMAVSNDIIMTSGRQLDATNVIWRISNDHAYPNVVETAASVAWHILLNAMNAILLGEIFPRVDSDMFRATDWHAPIQAVLRVISGGPIYISDTTPFHDSVKAKSLSLLSRLVTRSGKVPACLYPGRATSDCVFADPRSPDGPFLLKVWNRNSLNGLLAVCNICEDRCISGNSCPADVPDLSRLEASFVTVSSSPDLESDKICCHHQNSTSSCYIYEVRPMSAVLLHICPVIKLRDNIQIAVIGALRLLNIGGSVLSVGSRREEHDMVHVVISLNEVGVIRVWLDKKSQSRLSSASCGTNSDIPILMTQDHDVDFCDIDISSSQPCPSDITTLELLFTPEAAERVHEASSPSAE